MSAPPRRRRVRIGRLELDLRGIAPDTAQTAARSLGPRLGRLLVSRRERIEPADRIDAGRIVGPASADPGDLAGRIAWSVVRALGRRDA